MYIDLYYDKTPTEHQAKFDQLFSLGYRMVSLSVYGDPLQARYAAVWLKQDGPPWVACHGKHAAEYQQFFDHWTAQDYRLRIVTATGAGQGAVFAAVFEKSPSAGWFAKHGLISGQDADQKTFQYQCKFAKSNGYMLTWAAAYGDAPHPLFAGLWERNNTVVGWEYRLGEADAALQNDLLSFGASGGGPDLITRSSAANSYLSIWSTPAATEWWADFGLSVQDFDMKRAQYRAKGIFPLRLQGSGTGAQTRFAVVWGYLPPAAVGSWWTNVETFATGVFAIPTSSWGQNGVYDWATLAESKVTFVTHCPIDKSYFDRCHALGIRCFPYVTFYYGSYQALYGPITSNTYEGVDFSQHPGFFEQDSEGHHRNWGFIAGTTDGVGVSFPPGSDPNQPPQPWKTCPNVKPYQKHMVKWVEYIMGLGADGVFVDNIFKREQCYAPHAHIVPNDPNDPDAAQNKAFALLLQKVRAVIKKYKPDGLVLGNSGDPLGLLGYSLPEFQKYLDSDMLEVYICQGAPGRVPNWANTQITWDQIGRNLQAYITTGRQVLVISALDGTSPLLREDVFFCYAHARLAGLIWHGPVMPDARVADLFRVRLGQPLTAELPEPAEPSGVNYRVFERGLVAVNLDMQNSRQLAVQPLVAETLFCDLFTSSATPIDTTVTGGALTIPPYAGRVFLYASGTDFGFNRLV